MNTGVCSYTFRLIYFFPLQISVAEAGEERFRSKKVTGLTGERFSHPWDIAKPSFSAVLHLLDRNVNRFRGGLVFKAHRLLYHSTLGLRVIKKKKKNERFRSKKVKGQTGERFTNPWDVATPSFSAVLPVPL